MKPHKLPEDISGYHYTNEKLSESHGYLLPKIFEILEDNKKKHKANTIFDLGCGNGSVCDALTKRGYSVVGVDPSIEGIEIARKKYPQLRLEIGSAYDDLVQQYGKSDVVVSLEVVEHLYNPRKYAATVYSLLAEDGIAIISTPYHSYFKNLVIALTGNFDKHFTALWDNGHIKFWSVDTMSILLREAGFRRLAFYRVGRIPQLAKSMIFVAKK